MPSAYDDEDDYDDGDDDPFKKPSKAAPPPPAKAKAPPPPPPAKSKGPPPPPPKAPAASAAAAQAAPANSEDAGAESGEPVDAETHEIADETKDVGEVGGSSDSQDIVQADENVKGDNAAASTAIADGDFDTNIPSGLSLSPRERALCVCVAAAACAASVDASHDLRHTLRVWRLTTAVAAGEGLPERGVELARVAALLHDVGDEKYGGGAEVKIAAILRALPPPLSLQPADAAAVQRAVAGVSFRSELARSEVGAGVGADESVAASIDAADSALVARITACVQDADRLDAMGSLGVARAFTFGGARGRALYGPADLDAAARRAVIARESVSVAEYARLSETTVGHAVVKLLRLSRMLKTSTGKKLGARRHAAMAAFVDEFFAELGPDAQQDEVVVEEMAAAAASAVAVVASGGSVASPPRPAPTSMPPSTAVPAPARPSETSALPPVIATPDGDEPAAAGAHDTTAGAIESASTGDSAAANKPEAAAADEGVVEEEAV